VTPADRDCARCRGTRVVCESHPDQPWQLGPAEVCCGAPGMFCPDCAQPPAVPPQAAPAAPAARGRRPGGWFNPAPPQAASPAAPPVISVPIEHRGGPLDGCRSTAPIGPAGLPPPVLASRETDAGGGRYLRTSTVIHTGHCTVTVYDWQPAPGRRRHSDCCCGKRGCPNATRRRPS
jgi:hypothetical protein